MARNLAQGERQVQPDQPVTASSHLTADRNRSQHGPLLSCSRGASQSGSLFVIAVHWFIKYFKSLYDMRCVLKYARMEKSQQNTLYVYGHPKTVQWLTTNIFSAVLVYDFYLCKIKYCDISAVTSVKRLSSSSTSSSQTPALFYDQCNPVKFHQGALTSAQIHLISSADCTDVMLSGCRLCIASQSQHFKRCAQNNRNTSRCIAVQFKIRSNQIRKTLVSNSYKACMIGSQNICQDRLYCGFVHLN